MIVKIRHKYRNHFVCHKCLFSWSLVVISPAFQGGGAKYLKKNITAGTETNVVDPNTLNLDLDPKFWPNLDPDPGVDILSILKGKNN